MSNEESKLFSMDSDKWPTGRLPQVDVLKKNDQAPYLLELSKRKLNVTQEIHTVESLEEMNKKLKDQIGILEGMILKNNEMIAWAKENGIALTEAEGLRLQKIDRTEKQIKTLNEKNTPENIASRKVLERELKELKEAQEQSKQPKNESES